MNPLDPAATPIATRTSNDATQRQDSAPPAPTIRTSLARLARALTVRGADTADLSPAARAAAGQTQVAPATDAAQPLAQLRGLLGDLESLVGSSTANQDEAALAATQAEIDRVLGDVELALEQHPASEALAGRSRTVASVTNVFPGVENVEIAWSGLDYRERADFHIEIDQRAEAAALYLDFGASFVDLDTNRIVTLEIGGRDGARVLSFASGTSLANIRTAINFFTDVTGVRAYEDPTTAKGFYLASIGLGDDDFVSVHIRDDGVSGPDNRVVRAVNIDEAGEPSPGEVLSTFADLNSDTVIDRGVDFRITSPEAYWVYNDDNTINLFSETANLRFEIAPSDAPIPLTWGMGLPFGQTLRAFTLIGGAQTGANEGPGEQPIDGGADDNAGAGESQPAPPTDGATPPPTIDAILGALRPFATGGALSLAAHADQSQRLGALRNALALLDTIAPPAPPGPSQSVKSIDFSA